MNLSTAFNLVTNRFESSGIECALCRSPFEHMSLLPIDGCIPLCEECIDALVTAINDLPPGDQLRAIGERWAELLARVSDRAGRISA